jgi:pimeloyl-ACP methyl ester carboxylesterase
MPLNYEEVSITVDRQIIAGTFISAEKERLPGVLFVHGWGASQEQCLPQASAIAEVGCACLTFDLRGHGLTKDQRNRVSREHNLRDVIAGYDFLASRAEVNALAIGAVGTSYGAYLAAIVTSLRAVCHLALQAPAIYRDVDWAQPKIKLHEDPELALYRRRVVGPLDNRALRACAGYRGHVLIVECQYDAIVPHPVSESYAAAFIRSRTLRSRVIANADHALSEERWRREYTSILTTWLSDPAIRPPDR